MADKKTLEAFSPLVKACKQLHEIQTKLKEESAEVSTKPRGILQVVVNYCFMSLFGTNGNLSDIVIQ